MVAKMRSKLQFKYDSHLIYIIKICTEVLCHSKLENFSIGLFLEWKYCGNPTIIDNADSYSDVLHAVINI